MLTGCYDRGSLFTQHCFDLAGLASVGLHGRLDTTLKSTTMACQLLSHACAGFVKAQNLKPTTMACHFLHHACAASVKTASDLNGREQAAAVLDLMGAGHMCRGRLGGHKALRPHLPSACASTSGRSFTPAPAHHPQSLGSWETAPYSD